MVGQKKAREIFFLGRNYSAQDAMDMGMVNAVIPHDELEDTAYQWAQENPSKITNLDQNAQVCHEPHRRRYGRQQVFAGERRVWLI
jgi:naphthoate synthase